MIRPMNSLIHDLEMSIYNITTKISKLNDMKLTYLWHCHLSRINENCISKLHQDGFLDSFDFELYKIYESCLLARC